MCGIFGFVSPSSMDASIILDGLKQLEYRGYDSWGIAIKQGSSIRVEKHIGKIGRATTRLTKTLAGIGHTRWATHGGVTVTNAHPHLDCSNRLAIVHNGIVENYQQLKQLLTTKGHVFKSQTDTEVIAHLLEENLKKNTLKDAACKTLIELHGLNAFVAVDSQSGELVAAKSGSPLIIGFSHDTYYISSDSSAFPKEVENLIVINDNEVALLNESVWIFDPKTRETVKSVMEKRGKPEALSSKGKYAHYLLKEIHDQPEILSTLYKKEENQIKRLALDIHNAYGTFTLGCGTASYAAMVGEYYLSKHAKKHINFSVGSEFKYLQDFITKKSLIIPVSQSGETIDVVEPVKNAKHKGATIISIVNVPTSTLARLSDYSLLLHAGVEKAVVGTKSFTAMIGLFLLISYTVAGRTSEGADLLTNASKDISSILRNTASLKRLAKKLRDKDHAFTIGRGISHVAALEAAPKLKETALVHAEGFAGGELKHGVIALIEKGTPCFVFAPNDETLPEILSNAQEIKARGGFIVGIGPINNSVFDAYLQTADLSDGTIISQIVIMQLLSYYLALERGIEDPDKPRNLAKSVTVK